MTMFKHPYSMSWRERSSSIACKRHRERNDVQVSIAQSFSDFMDATPLLRRVATESYAPIAPDEVGRFLARLNHGGSGRDAGCVVLAWVNAEPVGFAVLLPKADQSVELAWLHAGDIHSDVVFDALWDKVSEITDDWDVPVLQIGPFAPMPGTANTLRPQA